MVVVLALDEVAAPAAVGVPFPFADVFELEEPLVFESAWLYSSENENPALLQFVNMIKQGEA